MTTDLTHYPDKELLSIFRDTERRHYAFNLIVRKYSERLYWHIRKLVISHEDSDDVLQNTFMKVWNGLDDFREASQLYTWLYRIATKPKKTKIFFAAY